MNFLPENDGIDHINVYSKGKTELGRFLSNFAYSPINLTGIGDGEFLSIEGYWYWLGTRHVDRDKLRHVYGYKAKHLGRELRGKDWQETEEFKRKILFAIKLKILAMHEYLFKIFINNTLPLTHYYVYGDKVFNVPAAQWILDGINKIKLETTPPINPTPR